MWTGVQDYGSSCGPRSAGRRFSRSSFQQHLHRNRAEVTRRVQKRRYDSYTFYFTYLLPNIISELILTFTFSDLIDITLKTMALIRRNELLQKRLNALQMETRAFVKSALNSSSNGSSINSDWTRPASLWGAGPLAWKLWNRIYIINLFYFYKKTNQKKVSRNCRCAPSNIPSNLSFVQFNS